MLPPASFEGLVRQASDAALVVDESGAILFATTEACKLLNYAVGELEGQSVEVLVPYRDRLAHIAQRIHFTDHRRTRPMGTGLKLFALCKDGSECPVDISLDPVQRGMQTLILATIRLRNPIPPAEN